MHKCNCGLADLCDCYALVDSAFDEFDEYEGSPIQQMNDEDWDAYIEQLNRRSEDV